jgi:predicted small metal-binding protein
MIDLKGDLPMTRKYIDCRDIPQSEKRCTVAISADSDDELVEAAVQHAMAVHGHDDTNEFRNAIRGSIREGHPHP